MTTDKPPFRQLGLIFLSLFIGFSLFLRFYPHQSLDNALLVLIQKYTPTSLDNLLALFSILGNFEIITLPLLFCLYQFKSRRIFFWVMAIYFFGLLIEIAGKYYFDHPGPPSLAYRNNLHVVMPSSTFSLKLGQSYPSGHSLRFTYLMVIVSYYRYFTERFSRWLMALFFLTLVVMLVSRVSLGEHWPSDVIGGYLLGAALAYFAITIIHQPRQPST